MEMILNFGVVDFEFAKAIKDKVLYIPLTPAYIKKLCIPYVFKPNNGLSIWQFSHLHLMNVETDEYIDFKIKEISVGKQPPIDDMVFFIVKFE